MQLKQGALFDLCLSVFQANAGIKHQTGDYKFLYLQ